MHRSHWGRKTRPLRPLALLVGLLLALALASCGSSNATENFGQREPGKRVYDTAGLLTTTEVAALEAHAAAAERAGAPTIVYLRAKEADEDDTKEDARELMDAWDVQSAPDARDGIVIFLNLKPGDLRHGRAAIWAGARHTGDGGNLPQRELERIYDDVMQPLLADGHTAEGIDAGLVALTNSQVAGPAPRSAAYNVARGLAGLPLNIVAFLVAGVTALIAARDWSGRTRRVADGAPSLRRPGDLPPALAGALAMGRIDSGALTEAVVLDLARRGALLIEAEDEKHARVRLLDAGGGGDGPGRALWTGLAALADTQGIIGSKQLRQIPKLGGGVERAVRGELEGRGWFDPTVGARRTPSTSPAPSPSPSGFWRSSPQRSASNPGPCPVSWPCWSWG